MKSDTGSFSIAPTWVVDKASPRALQLYMVLGTYADRDGECFPARKTLAARMDCSLDTIDRAVKELIRMKALGVTVRPDATSVYTLHRVAASAPRGGRTHAATGGRTDAARTRPIENQRSEAKASSRQDHVWDAMEGVFGKVANDGARGKRNKAVKLVKQSLVAADVPFDECELEIRRRARVYSQRYPSAAFTDIALAMHFDELAPPPPRARRVEEPEPVLASPDDVRVHLEVLRGRRRET